MSHAERSGPRTAARGSPRVSGSGDAVHPVGEPLPRVRYNAGRFRAFTARLLNIPDKDIPAVISFIIPAHDEEALIGGTLAAVHASARGSGEAYEVVVADDASTDRTAAIALASGARVVRVNRRQIAATRNAGARAAAGDTLFFVDADTAVTPRVVRAALRALRGGAVGGACCIRIEGRLPAYAVLVERVLQVVSPIIGVSGGCFLFCTRRAYVAAGGFDESLYWAEEVAFSRRLGRGGRFVVLREFVTTSGRKLRAHTGLQLLGVGLRLALSKPGSAGRREALEFWYGPRETAGSSE